MTTIQERLRMSAAVPIPETDEGMTLATVQAAMRVHHSLHRKAAAEIDRLQAALRERDLQLQAATLMRCETEMRAQSLQAALKASDEALIAMFGAENHEASLMIGARYGDVYDAARSRAAEKEQKG